MVGHAVSFATWWSLCHEQGLSDREAIDALRAFALVRSRGPGSTRP